MSNVSLYANAFAGGRELKQNNEERKGLSPLGPLDLYVVEPLARLFTDNIAIPFIQKSYKYTGIAVVQAIKRLSVERAVKIEQSWYDPVSTECLRRCAERIRQASLWIGKRKPTQIPIIEYPATCIVVAARHLYVISSDIHDTLNMPTQLREYANHVCQAADYSLPEEDIPVEVAQQPLVSYWDYWNRITKVCYDALQSGKNYIATKAIEITNSVTNLTKELIRRKTHSIIDEHDKIMRTTIVTKVVNAVARKSIEFMTRWMIRGGIGAIFYLATKEAIVALVPHKNEELLELAEKMAKTTSFFLMLTGGCLWIRCLSPTMKRLYHAREIKFDPEISTIREVASTLNNQSKVRLYTEIYQVLQEKEQSKVAAFIERVSKLQR